MTRKRLGAIDRETISELRGAAEEAARDRRSGATLKAPPIAQVAGAAARSIEDEILRLRRENVGLQEQGADRTFASDDLKVDLVRRQVERGGGAVKLSPKEYDILEQLAIHAGKVLTHRHLLREVWHDESVDPQYLRVYIRQLRQKIERIPDQPQYITTETGVGYRLREAE